MLAWEATFSFISTINLSSRSKTRSPASSTSRASFACSEHSTNRKTSAAFTQGRVPRAAKSQCTGDHNPAEDSPWAFWGRPPIPRLTWLYDTWSAQTFHQCSGRMHHHIVDSKRASMRCHRRLWRDVQEVTQIIATCLQTWSIRHRRCNTQRTLKDHRQETSHIHMYTLHSRCSGYR